MLTASRFCHRSGPYAAHLSLCALLTATPVASACAAEDATAQPVTDLASSLGQMLFGLAVVIAALIACLWLIKRLSAAQGASGALKILGSTAVGPRERVVLVEVGPQVLVLGVAPGNVRTLHIMDASQLPTSTAPAAGTRNDFAGWLRKSLERRNDAS